MNENRESMLPAELRHLLFQIIVECRPSDPCGLFRRYCRDLSEDFYNKLSGAEDDEELQSRNWKKAEHMAVYVLESKLLAAGEDGIDKCFQTDEYKAWRKPTRNRMKKSCEIALSRKS